MPDGAASTTAPMVTPTEIIHVDTRTVACDGGNGALGHPRVFLRIPDEQVMCPYCSRLYVLNPGADHASGH
ncbi:MAG: zinc-finger domain-containing protein [Rhodopila sp.]|nr:zinc-finger domain-containing protein [Rhodopila sp.]